MNKILYGVLITSFLISCGDNKGERSKSEETNDQAAAPIVITDPLKVSLNAIIPKDDTIEVYYRFDPKANFESMYVVNAPVKGQDSAQNVVFDLPTDKKIYDFRIDFGSNKEQSDIQIKNFNMQYKGNSFNVKDTLFFQYFWNNEFIDYTRNKAIAKPKSVNGNYDPIFMPRETFSFEIDKLFNPIPAGNQAQTTTK